MLQVNIISVNPDVVAKNGEEYKWSIIGIGQILTEWNKVMNPLHVALWRQYD